MILLRTPDKYFENLAGYPFKSNYLQIPFKGQQIRMHYLDEGDTSGETVLLLHGQPSWSYLYRKMIPFLVKAGYRVIVPDLIGFGKSDKPSKIKDYTYERQENWLQTALFDVLKLRNVTLYAQDWGGLLSLRIVAFHPEYFSRVMIANTGLPVGGKNSNFIPDDQPRLLKATIGALIWKFFARWTPIFPIGKMAQLLASESKLTNMEKAAYDAPFPSNKYLAGARAMPQLIPMNENSSDSLRNRAAWRRLASFDKPFRTAFSNEDLALRMIPLTDKRIQSHIKGAENQRHVRIANAGHFLQEDQGEIVAKELIAFIKENPL